MKLLTRLRELRNTETQTSYSPHISSLQDENLHLPHYITAFTNSLLEVDSIGVGTMTASDIKRIHADKSL